MTSALDIFAPVFAVTDLSQEERFAVEQIPADEATTFLRCVYRECKGSPYARNLLKDICVSARSSGATVSEYVRDIITVYAWLDTRHEQARSVDILEYVRCAREGSSLQMGHDIKWYLDTYGFEKIANSKI